MNYRSFQELAASIGLQAPKPDLTWHDYVGDQPIWSYHAAKSNKLDAALGEDFIGVELELIPAMDQNQLANEIYLATECRVICMEDGSLRNPEGRQGQLLQYRDWPRERKWTQAVNGFEVITDYGDLNLVLCLCDQIVEAVDGRAWSHDTACCGLHVHISRNGATQLELARLVIFWNSESNRKFLNCFTRREFTGYCMSRNVEDKKPEDVAADVQWGGRHELVNLTNAATIELRGFRGTIVRETLLACVQLAALTWKFARDPEIADTELTWQRFLSWLKSQSADYIWTYLQERNPAWVPEAIRLALAE